MFEYFYPKFWEMIQFAYSNSFQLGLVAKSHQ